MKLMLSAVLLGTLALPVHAQGASKQLYGTAPAPRPAQARPAPPRATPPRPAPPRQAVKKPETKTYGFRESGNGAGAKPGKK